MPFEIPRRTLRLLSHSLALVLCAACGQASQPAASGTTPTSGATYQNPVLKSDFPDPALIQVGNTFYAYATNAGGRNIQVARSADLANWEMLPDALPAMPRWAQIGGGLVWAPEVIQIGEQFVMYYTARDKNSNRQCIGVAVSDKPEGSFKDTSSKPLVCQDSEGGSIDPSPFRDGETLYLYWKNDGNCCGQTTYLYVQQLAPDGLSLVGEPTRLIQNDKRWEGNLIEAPTMFKHEDRYYLFFSANDYASPNYAIGYANCESPTGPCTKAEENPIVVSHLSSTPIVYGPGHQTVVQIGNETWMLYHAWQMTDDMQRGNQRFLSIDRVEWKDGKPVLRGPTTNPQPALGQ